MGSLKKLSRRSIEVMGENNYSVASLAECIAELEKRLGECEAARETGDKAVARNAELENEAKLHVRGCGKLVAKARAEERELWRNTVIKIQSHAHMQRTWGGMEWKYQSYHAKKINELCEGVLCADEARNLNNPRQEGE